jgi:hypothetical protein
MITICSGTAYVVKDNLNTMLFGIFSDGYIDFYQWYTLKYFEYLYNTNVRYISNYYNIFSVVIITGMLM